MSAATTKEMDHKQESCFLCYPDPHRVLVEEENFYALLGLGPLTEGYLVLASKDHYRSVLDLPQVRLSEYVSFKDKIKGFARRAYGRSILTEHGRIPLCSFEKTRHDPHCSHAHQLLFPENVDLPGILVQNGHRLIHFRSAHEASNSISRDKEYVSFEDDNGHLTFAVAAEFPRQYMRQLVAQALGVPERADWKAYEGLDEIERARNRLTAVMSEQSNRSIQPSAISIEIGSRSSSRGYAEIRHGRSLCQPSFE